MSVMTFGPPVVLDGPLPTPPPGRLLGVPGVLREPGDYTQGDHWMNGVSLWGYPEDLPQEWDPCSAGTFRAKSDDSNIPTPDFAAFTAYLPVTCSAFSIASDPDGFSEKSEVAMDARVSWIVAKQLSQGVSQPTNPFLADAGVIVLASGAAVPAPEAFAYLENAIGATAQGGMIHSTPGAASAYFSPWRDTMQAEDEPFVAVTSLGTPVAIDGGYIGATPHGQAAAGAGQSWIYATGPVHAFLARESTLNLKEVLDRSMNNVTFRAEREALVYWDTSLQVAVLADWTPV